jgi:hypothetical protein
MKQDLLDLIEEARRKLRRASGIPLSPEENAEERRTAEIEEFDRSAFSTFGYRLMIPSGFHVIWSDNAAVGQMTVDGRTFNLRRESQNYHLFLSEADGDRELSQLQDSDPNFASRVLVAVANTLSALKEQTSL